MSTTAKSDILLVLFGLFLGVYVFAKGFWLSRTEISLVSNCSFIYDGKCPPIKYKTIVIIIVDALKYDFIDTSNEYNDSAYWKGNMKVINDIMNRNSPIRINGILSHLIADPPTVTMTRLKGLTSGSLPTFTDIGFNFGGGSNIGEDNLIDQWNKNSFPIVFNGDDTWLELFPREKFHSLNTFSSFVVKDLDMVDQGVTKALNKQYLEGDELKNMSRVILINHLLGVDHCGHTYGQNHPEMRRKLDEMNSLLERIISKVDDSTLVLFLGDHGMTMRGDHGGDSDPETDAGLFLFSKAGFPTDLFNKVLTMSQIDLVPLLSFLSGIPIPFSNLGVLEPRLIDENMRIQAMLANARQVLNFALHYNMEGSDPGNRLNHVIGQLRSTIDSTGNFTNEKLILKLKDHLNEIREIYRAKWTRFDVIRIYQGLVIIFSVLLHLIRMKSLSKFGLMFQLFNFIVAFISLLWNPLLLTVVSTIVSASFCVVSIYKLAIKIKFSLWWSPRQSTTVVSSNNWTTVFTVSLWLLYNGSVLSNSFINNEDNILLFLIQTIIVFLSIAVLLRYLFRSNLRKFIQGRAATHFNRRRAYKILFVVCLIPTLICVIMSILINWRSCREEQFWCNAYEIIRPIASISDEFRSYKSWRYFSSVLCVLVMVFLHYRWFKYLGNINGFGVSALVMRYGLSSSSVFLCCYWTLQCLPNNFLKIAHPWHLTLFPRLTLLSCVISLTLLVISPLVIFLPSNDDVYVPSTTFHWSKVVPQIFQRIKELHSSRDEIIKVYGLYSVYSSWHLTTLLLLSVTAVLFLGDGFAAPIVLLVCAILCFLCFLYVLNNTENINQFDFASSWSVIVIWAFLSQYSFYITGHQASLYTLQWHSAYIIWHGVHSTNIIPFLSILVNTFAGPILVTWSLSLMLPLLCQGPSNPVYRFIDKEIVASNQSSENGPSNNIQPKFQDLGQSGEFSLADSDLVAAQYSVSLKLIYLKFIALHVVQALFAMYSSGFHRRHLMVWKIFAPRMIFCLSGLVTILITSIFSYFASIRLHTSVVNWKKSYLKRMS